MTPDWDGCRWDGQRGHYESWFQRANHPTRPLAFWIRHTLFCPKGKPEAAEAELWSVWFDGEKNRTVAAKTELPRRDCAFDPKTLDVKMPGASLKPGVLVGGTSKVKWDLRWSGGLGPSLLLNEALYAGGFPKAKMLTCVPNAVFAGTITVEGEVFAIDGWEGSHNHNWGSQHTDRYAWAQVCGFDDAPGVFLECGTGQVRIGPVMTPRVTVAALTVDGQRYAFSSLVRGALAKAAPEGLGLRFTKVQDGMQLDVAVDAPPERFVGLRYRNPIGGAKACLNSKIARCTATLRTPGHVRTFTTANRAAFEILCEENDPRVRTIGGLVV